MTRDVNRIETDTEIRENNQSANAAATPRKREWLTDIECLKGFAIFTVVWGHVYDANFPAWALNLRQAIYAFHMPLFLFLSGYVFLHVGGNKLKGTVSEYVTKRSVRLLLPFLAMAAIVILGKLVAGVFLRVDKPVNNIYESISLLFINTEKSPVQFIWYLVVLIYFYIITLFLNYFLKLPFIAIYAISVAMYGLHVYLFNNGIILDILYFNRILLYYNFFILGCLAYEHREIWLATVEKYWLLAGAVFVGLEYALFGSEWRYLFVGAASAFLFHGLIRRLFDGNAVLLFLGRHAFAIYLFNMLFIGLVKGLFEKLVGPPAIYPSIVIPLCTVVAIAGAVAIKFAIGKFERLKPISKALE